MPATAIDETKTTRLTKPRVRMRELILTAIVALIVLVFGLKKSSYNWDMIGYVAVALSAEGYHGADLDNKTLRFLGRRLHDALAFRDLQLRHMVSDEGSS